MAVDGQVDLATSKAIIAETLRVLKDKFVRLARVACGNRPAASVTTRLVEATETIHMIEADPNKGPLQYPCDPLVAIRTLAAKERD
jgi:hypothetical protein